MKSNLMPNYLFQNKKLNIILYCVLILSGIAGNYLKYQIFFNVDFIFGSIFSMLALQLFGLGWGIISAAVISTVTLILWNHPYAIIIMTLEVALVGLMSVRKKTGFVFADVVYWLCAGIPLVYLFYYVVMNVPMSNTLIIMLKQSINGIFNAIVARIIFSLAALFRWKGIITFRESIFNLIAFFVLVTSLTLLFIESRGDFTKTDTQVRRSLALTSRISSNTLKKWIDAKLAPVAHLAKMAEYLPMHELQRRIEQTHASDPDFLRMGMADDSANVVAYSPLIDELGQRNRGKNFSDRPYIPIIKRTLKPMLTEVVMGRIGVPKPFTSIVAPVIKNGVYAGYMIGVMDFNKILGYLTDSTEGTGLDFILLDKNRKVIVTSYKEYKTMTPYTRTQDKGEIKDLGQDISQWVPALPPNTSIMERWRKSYYIKSSKVGSLSEWELILEQPVEPFQKALNDEYSGKIIMVFSIFIITLVFADVFSRRIFSTTERLQEMTTALPAKLESGEATKWPRSIIVETSSLITNFRDMEEALKLKFNELETVNATLEGLVEKRTVELTQEIEEHKKTAKSLKESEEKYRIIFDNEIYGICIFDLETFRMLDINDAYVSMYGYSREEILSGMTMLDITFGQSESDRTLITAMSDGNIFLPLRYHRKKDGTVFPVEIVGGPFTWKGRRVMFALAHDITERKKIEEKLNQLLREQYIIMDTLPMGVIFAKDRKIQWSNSAFDKIMGYENDVILGIHTSEFYTKNSDYSAVGDSYAKLAKGETFITEIQMKKSDGSNFWCSLVGRAVNPGNMNEGSIWMFQDVTDKKLAYERQMELMTIQRSLVENIQQGILFEDKQRIVRFVNHTFCALFNIPSPDMMVGADCASMASQSKYFFSDPDGFENSIGTRIAEGRVVLSEELSLADGSIYERDYIPVSVEGMNYGHYWIYRDITGRKKAEAIIHEKTRELEDLTKNLEMRVAQEVSRRNRNEQLLVQQSKLATMGEMLGAIAHQWRQPLNTLGLCIQNIRDTFEHGELDREAVQSMVNTSMGHIKHMSKTIDDFRNFFLPDKGKSEFDSMVAVGDVLSLLSAQLSANNIAFRLTCRKHNRIFEKVTDVIPCDDKIITGFKNEFEHVIMNITNNAKESILERYGTGDSATGCGLISYDFDNRNGKVIITIGDNGTGIPEKIIDRIFEPYFTTKEQSKGTGIGLYMSKIIIEDHMMGSISARNEESGAAIIIELPGINDAGAMSSKIVYSRGDIG